MQQFLIDNNILPNFKVDDISNISDIINDKQTTQDAAIIIFRNVCHNMDEKKRDELYDVVFNKCDNKKRFF